MSFCLRPEPVDSPEAGFRGRRSWDETQPLDEPLALLTLVPGDPVPGTELRVVQCCGKGGSSRVYRAIDTATGRFVALKVRSIDSPISCDAFMKEGELLRSIQSPWVVAFEDMGLLRDGRPWFSMEYLEGRSLWQHLREVGRIEPMVAIRWLQQACRGLAALHDEGWVHRDIKPGNLVLGDGRIKLVDLGIAERIGMRPEMLSGTPDYIAPEQARGEPVDPSSDIYALGCCAHEMLTGQRIVARAASSSAKIDAHLEGIEVWWPDEALIPDELKAIVESCLAFDPSERPANARIIEDALVRVRRRRQRGSMVYRAARASSTARISASSGSPGSTASA